MKVDTLKNNQADEYDRVLRAVGDGPLMLDGKVTLEPFEWLSPILNEIQITKSNLHKISA